MWHRSCSFMSTNVILSFIVGTPSGQVVGLYGTSPSSFGEDLSASSPFGQAWKGDSFGSIHFRKPYAHPRNPLSCTFARDY